jgi:hypothetical protein
MNDEIVAVLFSEPVSVSAHHPDTATLRRWNTRHGRVSTGDAVPSDHLFRERGAWRSNPVRLVTSLFINSESAARHASRRAEDGRTYR